MKTACKVFIIIGMVVGFFWIAPPIVGFYALDKLKTARSKSELTGVAVCTLLFCNTIAGILMLCMPDSELSENPENPQQVSASRPVKKTQQTQAPAPTVANQDETIANMQKLKELKENGIIDEKEYEMLRKREVDKLFEDIK